MISLQVISVFSFFLIFVYDFTFATVNFHRFFFRNPISLIKASDFEIEKFMISIDFDRVYVRKFIEYRSSLRLQNKLIKSFDELIKNLVLPDYYVRILSRFSFIDGVDRFYDIDFDYWFGDYFHDLIDLNNFEDRDFIYILSLEQINAIRLYSRKGKFKSIYELLMILEISVFDFLRIKNYLLPLDLDFSKTGRNSITLRYIPENFLSDGNYFTSYFSVDINDNIIFNFSAGKLSEHSPFYPFFNIFGKNFEYNFYRQFSFSFYIYDLDSVISQIVFGDYTLRLAEHLLFGNLGINFFSDDPFAYPIDKKNIGISFGRHPFRFALLRGFAFRILLDDFSILPFFFVNSYELDRKIFSLYRADITYERLVNDYYLMGNDKNMTDDLYEFGLGFQLDFYIFDELNFGFNLVYFRLSHLIDTNLNYDLTIDKTFFDFDFDFSLNNLFLASFYFSWSQREIFKFLSEFAVSRFYDQNTFMDILDVAFVFSSIFDLFYFFDYAFMFRYLGENYLAPYSSDIVYYKKNVFGFIQSLSFKNIDDLKINLYFDIYQRFSDDILRLDFNFKISYSLFYNLILSFNFDFKKSRYFDEDYFKLNNKFYLDYKIYTIFNLKFNFYNVYYQSFDDGNGYFGDLVWIRFIFDNQLFSLKFHTIFYDIEDYKARIFIYNMPVRKWFQGFSLYNDRGKSYGVSVDFKLSDFLFSFFTAIDYRVLGFNDSVNNYKALFQIEYKW